MENMTMTNATRISRDRFGCPLAGAFLDTTAPVAAYQPSTTDVARSRAWRPPV